MRVTDLLTPWKGARGSQPAPQRDQDPVAALQNEVNRAFDEFLRILPAPFPGWPTTLSDNASNVQVNVVETDKDVEVTAELPGVEEGDVDVQISDGMLTISGDKKARARNKRERLHPP